MLGDVANVVEEHQPLIGDAIVNGSDDRLLLVVEKFPGADTVEVTSGVEDALERAAARSLRHEVRHERLPAGDLHRGRDRQSQARVHHRRCPLALVLAAFLFSWRTTLISLVDDPAVSGGGGARALPAR